MRDREARRRCEEQGPQFFLASVSGRFRRECLPQFDVASSHSQSRARGHSKRVCDPSESRIGICRSPPESDRRWHYC